MHPLRLIPVKSDSATAVCWHPALLTRMSSTMSAALPSLLLQFTTTVVLSFVPGLELHSYRRTQDAGSG